jgi:hypothetical protein
MGPGRPHFGTTVRSLVYNPAPVSSKLANGVGLGGDTRTILGTDKN